MGKDNENKVTITGYFSEKDHLEKVKSSINEYIQREIKNLKEPPVESVEVRVPEFLK